MPDFAEQAKDCSSDANTEMAVLQARNQQLQASLAEQHHVQDLYRALLDIAEVTATTKTLDALYHALHIIVGKLMYAENFFIALYDEGREQVYMPYYVDSALSEPAPPMPREAFLEKLTGYVLRTGEPLLANQQQIEKMRDDGIVKVRGAIPLDWLGVPLKADNDILGVMVVQSYQAAHRFGAKEKELLIFVSQHIATALWRKRAEQALQQANEELESRVARRTQELSVANQQLANEITERKRAEALQKALYRIVDLTNTAEDLTRFYQTVHTIISDLMYAKNFFIATVNTENQLLEFPYVVDEYRPNGYASRDLDLHSGKGLTERVLISRQPVLLMHDTLVQVERYGQDAIAWLGVPLIDDDGAAIGVIAVQSYDPNVTYGDADKELLWFVSKHITTSLNRKRDADRLKAAHEELKSMQQELVASAHQAGMSEIATGILHNIGNLLNSINISIHELKKSGTHSKVNSLRMTSDLILQHEDRLGEFFETDAKGKKIPRFLKALTDTLEQEKQNMENHLRNVEKCAHTISEVIATQQKYATRGTLLEEVDLQAIFEDALATQHTSLEKYSVEVRRDFSPVPHLRLQKSKLLNVLVNLIKNAKEAQLEKPVAERWIEMRIAMNEQDHIQLEVRDNGHGITAEDMPRLFTHGFTTKKTGHGFGLHSCAISLVEMGGTISATSEGKDMGSNFIVQLPVIPLTDS